MRINVKLFASLRAGRFKVKELEYPTPITVMQLLDELNIVKEGLGMILVNGHASTTDRELSDGDTLSLFPPVGGG